MKKQRQKLTEAMYYVLLSLSVPRHGYEAMQNIEQMTQGRVRVGAGTLYGLIARFEKEGLIEQVSDDGRRKTYLITGMGIEKVKQERKRLFRMLEDGRKVFEKVQHDPTILR